MLAIAIGTAIRISCLRWHSGVARGERHKGDDSLHIPDRLEVICVYSKEAQEAEQDKLQHKVRHWLHCRNPPDVPYEISKLRAKSD